jgi:hypothetical protein
MSAASTKNLEIERPEIKISLIRVDKKGNKSPELKGEAF